MCAGPVSSGVEMKTLPVNWCSVNEMPYASGDLLAPIDASGRWLPNTPFVPIDLAHRRGMLHRGVWLHVLSSEDELLLTKRSQRMKTCPGTLSIIGEHHSGRENDDDTAKRALHEELPGLARRDNVVHSMLPLRPTPRWFLYDYPLGAGDAVRRLDRCLVSEYVVRLLTNTSQSLALIHAAHEQEQEHESSDFYFQNLRTLWHQLNREPGSFCAPALLPSALLDTLSDLSRIHGIRGAALINRSSRRAGRVPAPALPEAYDVTRVVREE